MCMYACINMYACKTRGVLGHAPPGKLDALRLLLRLFLDRSRAVVATWLAEYCIHCPCMYLQANTADFEFPRDNERRYYNVDRTAVR